MGPISTTLERSIGDVFDPDWYRTRYPDHAHARLDPLSHFLRHGLAACYDPNRFFDSAWYAACYPDVVATGLVPLVHYLEAGAKECRHPHPGFDAAYYVAAHPDAADNPLLYHLRIGQARGYPVQQPMDIGDYLPSIRPQFALAHRIFVDVIIPVRRDTDAARRCLRSVLAERPYPLARIIVVDDASPDPIFRSWLRALAAEGQIHLIRNRRVLGFAASVNLGIQAAENHDVAVVHGDAEVSADQLHRLAAQAWGGSRVATVSPLGDLGCLDGLRDVDDACRSVNAGRFAVVPAATGGCVYVRHDALRQIGGFHEEPAGDAERSIAEFCRRATAAGWDHRIACDTFVPTRDAGALSGGQSIPDQGPMQTSADPFCFALTAALFRGSRLPVILLVADNPRGGLRHHIDTLVARYRNRARFFLLRGTDRGVSLSVPAQPSHPAVRLASDRIDDLVLLLRSANLSRVHIHGWRWANMDIRTLIRRLGVPLDVTVHDYSAICAQTDLVRWPDGGYCGEPGPAVCNNCIAGHDLHGARDILSWRLERAWSLQEAARVICPSADTARRLGRYGFGKNVIVVPHEYPEPDTWRVNRPTGVSRALRIAVIGDVAGNGRARQAIAAEVAAAGESVLEIHWIGPLEPDYPDLAANFIHAAGDYRIEGLETLLTRIRPHCVWFPSLTPEINNYGLDAAIAAELPIVAARTGSFPERLAGRPLTWLVDPDATALMWLAAFDALRAPARGRKSVAASVLKPTGGDFYAESYLTPAATPTVAAPNGAKPRIVVLPERLADGSLSPSAYIRLLLPLDHAAIGGGFEVVLADAETVFDHRADIFVTQGAAVPNTDAADRLVAHARRQGAALLYDLDHDLLAVSPSHPAGPLVRAGAIRGMLAIADAVWVATPSLAHRLAKIRLDVRVVADGLDERLWEMPDAVSPWWDHPVRILCMDADDRDLELVEPALIRLKAEYGERLVIDILGGQRALQPGLNRISPPPHASRSYPALVQWLTTAEPGWHIGLAPLADARRETGTRLLAYGGLGLAVLGSDVPAHRGSIADGIGGQLVRNDHRAWHAALDWLIRDQSLRRSLGDGGRAALKSRHTLIRQAADRVAAWRGLLANRSGAPTSVLPT